MCFSTTKGSYFDMEPWTCWELHTYQHYSTNFLAVVAILYHCGNAITHIRVHAGSWDTISLRAKVNNPGLLMMRPFLRLLLSVPSTSPWPHHDLTAGMEAANLLRPRAQPKWDSRPFCVLMLGAITERLWCPCKSICGVQSNVKLSLDNSFS